ncbi:hypothetical protein [Grimontia sp. SpTr1]|uniref:hypothetical protein n=1 Tax=Grimontia sp. SpTr1 TaxID=2995319 RepID=UPI00248D0708|nr:hypothetical protein [Grimontia sp. SpTr1]
MTPGFPTLGDVLKSVIDWSGLLAQKGHSSGFIKDETQKKTVQTQLRRLAREEGDLNKNLGDLLLLLEGLLSEHLGDDRLSFNMMNAVRELLEDYRQSLNSSGTYLDKEQSISWYVSAEFINGAIYSITWNSQIYSLTNSFTLPPGVWWVPAPLSIKRQTPIGNVWTWIYEQAGLTKNKFHNPTVQDDFDAPENQHKNFLRRQQHLENAIKWSKGRAIPSVAKLLENFEQSVDLHKKIGRELFSDELKKSCKFALIVARFTTQVFHEAEKVYGPVQMLAWIKQVRSQCRRIDKECAGLNAHITKYRLGELDERITDREMRWYIDLFWNSRGERIEIAEKLLREKCKTHKSQLSSDRYWLRVARRQMGSFAAFASAYTSMSTPDLPKHFGELFFQGLDLKAHAKSKKEIDEFGAILKANALNEKLAWLTHWCFARLYYREGRDATAYKYYKRAFEAARYVAGKEQYLLVNEFAEICAKNQKQTDYKRAVAWACYLGIRMRWVRGKLDEGFLFDEAADFGYTMLSMHELRYK